MGIGVFLRSKDDGGGDDDDDYGVDNGLGVDLGAR